MNQTNSTASLEEYGGLNLVSYDLGRRFHICAFYFLSLLLFWFFYDFVILPRSPSGWSTGNGIAMSLSFVFPCWQYERDIGYMDGGLLLPFKNLMLLRNDFFFILT